MSYADILAARGYRRVTVQRTDKAPGDHEIVLGKVLPVVVAENPVRNVVAMPRRGGAV
jgi:hypothetical protein